MPATSRGLPAWWTTPGRKSRSARTEIAWHGDGVVEPDDDKASGEFGLRSTAVGMQELQATEATASAIEALGDVSGTLQWRRAGIARRSGGDRRPHRKRGVPEIEWGAT